MIKQLFHKTIINPSPYLAEGFPEENFCVLASIILQFHKKFGPPICNVTKATMTSEIRALNFQGLFKYGQKGLQVTDFKKLENLNTPFSNRLKCLFPALAFFTTLSLNLFQIRRQNKEFRIFPISLSENYRDSSSFQVDMVKLNADILDPRKKPLSKSKKKYPDLGKTCDLNHVLLVPNLAGLLTKFTRKNVNKSKYQFVCRSCCSVFRSVQGRIYHYTTCSPNTRQGSTNARKRARNMYIHRPTRFNSFSSQIETNGLKWQRGHAYRMLKPLLLAFADLECYAVKDLPTNSIFHKVPKQAIMQQKPMGWAYTFISLYNDIDLPEPLANPRIKYCTQTPGNSDSELFISFFLNLRNDLVHISKHLDAVLQKNTPPQPKHKRDPKILSLFAKASMCDFCGRRFQSRAYSALSGKSYKVIKCFDHDHYQSQKYPKLSSGLRAILCQGIQSNNNNDFRMIRKIHLKIIPILFN